MLNSSQLSVIWEYHLKPMPSPRHINVNADEQSKSNPTHPPV